MKRFAIILMNLFLLSACNRESSPDGRAQVRDEKLQKEIENLKSEDKTLRDSINLINNKLKDLHTKN